MTAGKLFVNNTAGTLKELLSFHHRIKSVWKTGTRYWGYTSGRAETIGVTWHPTTALSVKKELSKGTTVCPKDVTCSRTNLDTNNSEQKAKLKTGQEPLQLCQGYGSFPFLISIICLSHSIIPTIKMWDVGYLQELHPLTIHSSRSWNHEWKIQQVTKCRGRSWKDEQLHHSS